MSTALPLLSHPSPPDDGLHELRQLGFLAASARDTDSVARIIACLQGLEGTPLAAATIARLWWATGQDAAGARCLEDALHRGPADAELAALATLALPDGDRWGQARLCSGTPGQRADAACDLAVRCLYRDDEDGARAWVQVAIDGCPDHAEALHWQRFFDDHGGAASAVLSAVHDDPAAPGWADVLSLVPTAAHGWMSGSRLRRRVYCPTPPASSPADNASAHLADRGIQTRILATESDYAILPPDHELVACEQALDLAFDLEAEQRSPQPAAARAWDLARSIDRQAACDAANALVTLGCHHDDVNTIALRAAALLMADEPEEPLWAAYRIRLLTLRGDCQQAVAAAGDIGPVARLDTLSLSMVVTSLCDCDDQAQASRLLRQARRLPHLRAHADDLAEALAEDRSEQRGHDLSLMVSDRLRPRFALDHIADPPAA